MAIEYIYFDLGNVILGFDHSVGLNKIAAATGKTPDEIDSVIFGSGLENEFETGLIDAKEFHRRFCETIGCALDSAQLFDACSDIFTLNAAIMPLIGQLAAVGFPIGILSNTCSAHWEFVFTKHPFLRQSFRHYVLSYESKSMKPDSQIYSDAVTTAGFDAEQIFFMDDREENVFGAAALGIDAVQFESAGQITAELQRRGVRFNL
jgi:putative hydrolase of the HAD superfamily